MCPLANRNAELEAGAGPAEVHSQKRQERLLLHRREGELYKPVITETATEMADNREKATDQMKLWKENRGAQVCMCHYVVGLPFLAS